MAMRLSLTGILAAGTLSIAALVLTTPAVPSASRSICTERSDLVDQLSRTYQEKQHGLGITSAGQGTLEFFASKKGSWTIIVTTTEGETCILATGHSWHATPSAAEKPEA